MTAAAGGEAPVMGGASVRDALRSSTCGGRSSRSGQGDRSSGRFHDNGGRAMTAAAIGAAPAMGGACDRDGRQSNTRGGRSSRPGHNGRSSRWIDFRTAASGPRLRRAAEPHPGRSEPMTEAQQLELRGGGFRGRGFCSARCSA